MTGPNFSIEEIEVKLSQLRKLFVIHTISDIEEISALSKRLGSSSSALHRQSIRKIAHVIAGRGGTFGFSEISQSASALEDVLQSGLADREVIDCTTHFIASIRLSLSQVDTASDKELSEDGNGLTRLEVPIKENPRV